MEQLRTLRAGRTSSSSREVAAPALIARIADAATTPLPAPCIEWATAANVGKPGWIWLRSESIESAMATALRMLRIAGLGGRVERLGDFAAVCRESPIYGERSHDAVIRSRSRDHALAIAISNQDLRDTMTSEILLELLRQRSDALLPAIIAAADTGADILDTVGRSNAEMHTRSELIRILMAGLTGFSPTESKAPCTVGLVD